MTREEIENAGEMDEHGNRVLTVGEWLQLRDLALQALSQESVRSEALEEAAKVAESHVGSAGKDISATRWKQMDDETREQIRAEQRGEDIAAALIATAIRALQSPARVAEGEDVPSADEVPHFWIGHRDKEPSVEEIVRMGDKLAQAVTEDYWKDGVVQWPQRFLHTKECNVHEPTLRPCSCGLETRLHDEIVRLQYRLYKKAAPESPAKEQPEEQNAALGLERAFDHSIYGAEPAVAAPDVAAMVKRLREKAERLRSEDNEADEFLNLDFLLDEAAALIEKLRQGWIPVAEAVVSRRDGSVLSFHLPWEKMKASEHPWVRADAAYVTHVYLPPPSPGRP